jgi:hypothetical protein
LTSFTPCFSSESRDIIALAQAGMDADVPTMQAAWPDGSRAYELHLTGLDRWITSIGRSAFLSKKVIQVADITLIAISIYQVAKIGERRCSGRRVGATMPPHAVRKSPRERARARRPE